MATQPAAPPGLSQALQDTLAEANRCLRRGDLPGARHLYQSLVDQPLLLPRCLTRLGQIAALQGDPERAVALLDRVLQLAPQECEAYPLLDQLFAADPEPTRRLRLWLHWGIHLERAQQFDAAIARFQAILALEPRHYAAWLNLATIQSKSPSTTVDADRGFLQAARLAARVIPEIAQLLAHIAPSFAAFDSPEPPLGAELPLGAEPPPGPPVAVSEPEKALTSLGYACIQRGEREAAIACQRLAIRLAPGFALAHWNLALALLLEDDGWSEGWQEYEWRWQWPECPEPKRHLPIPTWQGEDLRGRRILVWTEQGFGDAIQFLPLIYRLQELGATVFLQTPAALQRLFAQSLPDVPVSARPNHPDAPGTDEPLDFVIPLLSLPARLQLSPQERPWATRYLRPDPGDAEHWKKTLADAPHPRIALVWAGNTHNWSFENARVLLATPDISWFSLQLGPEQQQLAADPVVGVQDLSAAIQDFADTAAILSQMDLVISIDSAVAHLAGALGFPVWVLVHSKPNFRWPGQGEHSPWYPQMRLFRRELGASWSSLLPRLQQALAEWRATAFPGDWVDSHH